MEAFSDGVIAVIITVMVLDLKVPHGTSLAELLPLYHVFLAYVLSFVFVGIYWNQHHHLLHATQHVNGTILWANLHLLFWLSLIPFVTGWMSENEFAAVPVAMYGVVLFMCGIAFTLLVTKLIRHHGPGSAIATALAHDHKSKLSLAGYALAIPLAFINPWIALALFVAVAALWLIPDRRIEAVVKD